jgi:hypothetical protein
LLLGKKVFLYCLHLFFTLDKIRYGQYALEAERYAVLITV